MAKYDALGSYLSTLSGEEWTASFKQIEAILGFPLPASARRYPAWWANQESAGHSQAQAWQGSGWQSCDLNLKGGTVRFRRMTPARGTFTTAPLPHRSLAEEARQYSGIEKEEDLVREGLKALIEREAARQLAALGGSMPGFAVPDRRRSE